MTPVLRVAILSKVVTVAEQAAKRLAGQLKEVQDTDLLINMEHVFRYLTLQVIGDILLSLTPEESDKVRTVEWDLTERVDGSQEQKRLCSFDARKHYEVPKSIQAIIIIL